MSGFPTDVRARLLVAIVGLGVLGAGCDLAPVSTDGAANRSTAVRKEDAGSPVGEDAADLPPVAEAPTGPFRCDGVDVTPGDDLAAIASREPAGTTFCIRSGVHRVGEVHAQTGDRFLGESGAVLNGARDISAGEVDWRRSSDAWVVGGQTQQSEPLTLCHHADKGCVEGAGSGVHPNQYNEELFADDRRLQRVASRGELAPGRWYFDQAADQIWLAEDPAALGRIEATVYQGAIGSAGGATDVVIDNLVIEKYGSLPGRGAVGGWDQSTRDKTRDFRWRFRNITGRFNHGAAVFLVEGDRLENCKLTHNGQLGFKAVGERSEVDGRPVPRDFDQRVIVRNCEIAHNNQLNYRTGWEAGGFKIGQMPGGSVIEHVWSHHNNGVGMWWDSFSGNAVVRSNLVEDNLTEGIHYEISYGDTEIYWNRLRDNGVDAEHMYS
ncbi:MAG: right-handed parallel beta-helix repeat-containing protein, partial [Aldersonia sp.]|nr:right-handed parallel beta-helix repeat-containing protein [Aldersonia sp.]